MLASIEEQGKHTDELRAALMAADTKSRVEDIYLPYKPKRRTKAQIAREAGLEPLADRLLADPALIPGEVATELPMRPRRSKGRDTYSPSVRPRTPSSSVPSARSSGRAVRYERRPGRMMWRKVLLRRSFATTSSSPNRWRACRHTASSP